MEDAAPRKKRKAKTGAQQKRARKKAAAAAAAAPEPAAPEPPAKSGLGLVIRKTTHVKKKVLVLCSRGVTSTFRDLAENVLKLLPHGYKDPKFNKREPLTAITEIAQLAGCRYVLYFEARKRQDLYLWAAGTAGPSAKFLVQQIKPMEALWLTGNCLLGSRPLLSFDGSFDQSPHMRLLKQLLATIFQAPKGHPRSKPFHDHVLAFAFCQGRVVLRHYQVVPPTKTSEDGLVEIGPRLALVPIKFFGGAFGGATLYDNGAFISPNVARSEVKRKRKGDAIGHVAQKQRRRDKVATKGALPDDPLDDVFD